MMLQSWFVKHSLFLQRMSCFNRFIVYQGHTGLYIPLSYHLEGKWTKYGTLLNPKAQVVSVMETIITNTRSWEVKNTRTLFLTYSDNLIVVFSKHKSLHISCEIRSEVNTGTFLCLGPPYQCRWSFVCHKLAQWDLLMCLHLPVQDSKFLLQLMLWLFLSIYILYLYISVSFSAATWKEYHCFRNHVSLKVVSHLKLYIVYTYCLLYLSIYLSIYIYKCSD